MIAPKPILYPFLDGKYVIDRSTLPEELRKALEESKHLEAMARGSRQMAERWEREGRPKVLVEGRRKLTTAYEASRNMHLARLWTFYGIKPPAGLAFDHLRIIGE